jgi:hypothetical protein
LETVYLFLGETFQILFAIPWLFHWLFHRNRLIFKEQANKNSNFFRKETDKLFPKEICHDKFIVFWKGTGLKQSLCLFNFLF